jgi:zinc protease
MMEQSENPVASGIVSRRLSNGLKVLVAPRPGCRVATVDMWVNVGSADEPAAFSGASHFLEHMLFKGTARFSLGQIDHLIEGMGGVLNAATSHDYTHYHVTAASASFPKALDIIADMVANALLDAEEIDNEREVIIEEYLIMRDNPQSVIWEELYDRCYESGPYKRSIIGSLESLRGIGRPELLDYYERHYAPENMTLLLVGDLEPERAFDTAERAFYGFHRALRPFASGVDRETRLAPVAEHVLEKEIHETYAMIAFPVPPLRDHEEAYALDVMQFVLGGGDASMLYQELKEKRRLVSAIHTGYPNSRYDDLFHIYFTCEENKRRDAQDAIFDQLALLGEREVDAPALKRARKLLASEHEFNLETTEGESGSIGYFHAITGDIAYERNYVQGVMSVDAARIRDLARQYLSSREAVRLAIRPGGRTNP